MNKNHTVQPEEDLSPDDRQKLSGLLGFAQGVLTAREKVQMTMSAGLGVFHETDIQGLPGLHLDCDDGAWLRIDRQRETKPPEPADYVASFLASRPTDPAKPPVMKSAISIEISIEEASDLEEAGLLRPENVKAIVVDGVELENHVKIALLAEDCKEMQREFERYSSGLWADWARGEKPIRKSISFYNDLFKIHATIHTAESTPPELVWGIGIGRWEHAGQRIDMPIVEQLVDIEVEDGGAIAIHPRDLPPTLSLKPYLEFEIDGSSKLQRALQDRLVEIMQGDAEISPFTTTLEPILDTAASNLSSTGEHIDRVRIDAGETLPRMSSDLKIASTWAIFGRPRSHEARTQDLDALRKRIADQNTSVPSSIKGFAKPPSDVAHTAVSDWGIDSTILAGAGENTWNAPSGSGASDWEPSASPVGGAAEKMNSRRVHFFPLPFNEEQGKISDMIDDKSLHVATVSGPPGTGKSHSIANIISHQMATGKRVLVTARTPEAIAAVREKLPKSLQPLVIASVGTDRESAQQLQDAVTELSNEVVGLNTDEALATKAMLERKIVDCDNEAAQADLKLAEIARTNLAPLDWQGKTHPPMDLVGILEADAEQHGWFTDRPKDLPPSQLADLLHYLRQALPELAGDIIYAGADLPRPDELPATADLIAAHDVELAWNRREVVDYSGAPQMALDSAGAENQARNVLHELEACASAIEELDEKERDLAILATQNEAPLDCSAIEKTRDFLTRQENLDAIASVRFSLDACSLEDFQGAAQRGAAGQKPVGFSLFGGALKQAVASTCVNGESPASADDWRAVHAACLLKKSRDSINSSLMPFIEFGVMGSLPLDPWDLATYLKDRQSEADRALEIARRLTPICSALRVLFPYGLDIDGPFKALDCQPALFALRANLPDAHRTPQAITTLTAIADKNTLPIFGALRDLAAAVGQPETDPQQIVTLRGEITREITRLSEIAPRLKELGVNLKVLADCGAPEWAARLKEDPLNASSLIPDTWQAAWSWAMMTARVQHIIELGNGDEYRKAKADAMQLRRKHFEELIRIRTLLGLAKRLTPRVRQAMEAFTQAISKIGTGKGKKAPRFIRAAQEAARQASSAAPVWIMPEYKIPEQLPPEFGDFDLVILDEASQSDITAIAALARGKKILVVGDEAQVSPTAVGISVQKINALRAEFLDGLPNAGLIDENTSIFEMTKRMHPESHVMLREHFRCVAPIIQFSTRFYNNALVPLRVPKASERFDPPLVDVYIPGAARQGKTNPYEARWIVDEIAKIIDDQAHNGRDIGVISLIGGEQAEKIGRMLVEDERIGPEKIEERRIIYGDARTMQGQERSIVFLSMVATPGRVTSQSSKPDQQRINVAMSRARDRLYLVRSVGLEDLKPTDIKADILHHFVDPMPNGRVVTGTESSDLMDRCDSGFEREVLGRLLEANYRVRPQVKAGGFSIDLVVEGHEDRRLAIELDGDQYHGPEVWDRDMARQAALERAGWTFWRVFGSQWNAQKEFWWKNLLETLDRMKIDPIGAIAIDERFTETVVVDMFAETGDTPPTPADPSMGEEAGDSHEEPDTPTSPQEHPAKPAATGDDSTPQPEAASSRSKPSGDDLFSFMKRQQGALDEDSREDDMTVEALERAMDGNPTPAIVRIGSTVCLEKIENGGGKLQITIVENGNDPDHGLVGVHTPLGQALIDAHVGDDIEYNAGSYLREVRVLSIS
jgi:transcription elongation GreA/GreB family factor/very-short-patch-repair endonuclease